MEFSSEALDESAWRHWVRLDFLRPGKSFENDVIESFNGRPPDEGLIAKVFTSVEDAQRKIHDSRYDYNEHRPRSPLGYLTLRQFIERGQDNPSRAAKRRFKTVSDEVRPQI